MLYFIISVRIFPTSFTFCIFLLANKAKGEISGDEMLEMPWKLNIKGFCRMKLHIFQIVLRI